MSHLQPDYGSASAGQDATSLLDSSLSSPAPSLQPGLGPPVYSIPRPCHHCPDTPANSPNNQPTPTFLLVRHTGSRVEKKRIHRSGVASSASSRTSASSNPSLDIDQQLRNAVVQMIRTGQSGGSLHSSDGAHHPPGQSSSSSLNRLPGFAAVADSSHPDSGADVGAVLQRFHEIVRSGRIADVRAFLEHQRGQVFIPPMSSPSDSELLQPVGVDGPEQAWLPIISGSPIHPSDEMSFPSRTSASEAGSDGNGNDDGDGDGPPFLLEEQSGRSAQAIDFADGMIWESDDIPAGRGLHGVNSVVDECFGSFDVNGCDDRGRAAVHYASVGGHAPILQLLVDWGANVHAQDMNGNTPLHLAVLSSHLDCVIVLLRAGGNVNILDKFDRTPLKLIDARLQIVKARLADANRSDMVQSNSRLFDELRQIAEVLGFYSDQARTASRVNVQHGLSRPTTSSSGLDSQALYAKLSHIQTTQEAVDVVEELEGLLDTLAIHGR
ncbi:uncharacterized protein BJ171DRAFT_205538 [Polychytrium aggregatum]|uniref:uncharacterized protein n=1 Tax=Polychytrium aggregatum TaxID=110093 RepID=UPI0022FE95D6|nr:uncharacterized protein BJ171DRAFT_205538 [Polychytrium aggregatum]KAI9199645.1 hypothetical protein BJ171DRAFT_205538 [Polychytrium aggregatum]